MTETASADVPTVRLVDHDGAVVGDVDVGLADDDLRELLRLMIRCRRLDRECWALQRQGELTVYPPFEGQEAAQVGSAFALGREDFVFPSSGARGRDRARRRRGRVPPVPPRNVARWPLRSDRLAVRTDLRPGRDADRARGGLGDGREARRDRGVLAGVLR
jgi:hypothetical protein